MGLKALIYARESVYEDKAGTRSTDEQVTDGLARCDQKGWQPLLIDGEQAIIDSGKTATRKRRNGRRTLVRREGWERVKRIIAGDEAGIPIPDVLVYFLASRAQRDLDVYVELRNLCADHHVLLDYNGKTFDMDNDDDRFHTGLDALLAEKDAAEVRKHVNRAMRANAASGMPHGQRTYGYQRVYNSTTGALVGQVPHEREAPVVREVFRMSAAGVPSYRIAKAINVTAALMAPWHGPLLTRRGHMWEDFGVRRVLVNPAYRGIRMHNGEEHAAVWDALVDQATWDAVQARLADRAKRRTRTQPTASLLAGVARCGVCGGRMRATGAINGRKPHYRCVGDYKKSTGKGWCVGRDREKLDTYITAVVLARLKRPDIADAVAGAPNPDVATARAEAAEMRARIDDAVDRFTAGKLTATTLGRIEADLLPKIEAAERRARQAIVPLHLELPDDTDTLPTWWMNLGQERRREVVAALISRVVVSSSRSRWTPMEEVVRIEWRR